MVIDETVSPEKLADIEAQRKMLQLQYQEQEQQLGELYRAFNRDSFTATTIDGREIELPVSKVVRAYFPNEMSVWDKAGFYTDKLAEFILDDPGKPTPKAAFSQPFLAR